MLKSFDDILKFNAVAAEITNKFGEDPKNKFLYAVVKNRKKVSNIIDTYNKWQDEYKEEKLSDIRIELASVDKDGNLIIDSEGKFSYTKENMKKLTKSTNETFKELINRLEEYKLKEFDVDNYFTTDENSVILENLDEDQLEALRGFVIQ